MNYLPVSIYRDSDRTDCTNSGVTSPKFDNKFVVECETGHVDANTVEARGYIVLKRVDRNIGGKPYVHLVPVTIPEGRWSMFGGNFAYTSDSRFSRAFGGAPVAIHDRVE